MATYYPQNEREERQAEHHDQINSRLFYALDYGRQCLRSLELWGSRGMWADQANAVTTAQKAFHWAGRYLDGR
jgi:hypothetical protein